MFGFLSDPFELVCFLLMIPAALLAISVHESAHAWAAYRLGDPTARNLGRITLNPMKHFHPIGFLALIFLHIGWANPVPINPRYFKKPRRDMALSAAAGPLSNLILGVLGMICLYLVYAIAEPTAKTFSLISGGSFYLATGAVQSAAQKIVCILLLFFYEFSLLNINLAVFNLIPVPPFDGSRLAYVFLPSKWYFGLMRYERYIMIALILLLYLGVFSGVISAVSNGILSGVGWLLERIPFLNFA